MSETDVIESEVEQHLPERKCERCSSVYTPREIEQKYCKKTCARRASKARQKDEEVRRFLKPSRRECEGCGLLYAMPDPDQKYCTPECERADKCPSKSKLRVSTEMEIRQVAEKASRKAGRPLYYYKCPGCWQWHLTKKPYYVRYRDRKAKEQRSEVGRIGRAKGSLKRAVYSARTLEELTLNLSRSVPVLSL